MIRLFWWVIDTSGPTVIEQWKALDEKEQKDLARAGRPELIRPTGYRTERKESQS